MEQDFYKGNSSEMDLSVIVPDAGARKVVHDIIYDELCLGVISESSKQSYTAIIDQLVKDGAEAVILGCTEITMLISQQD